MTSSRIDVLKGEYQKLEPTHVLGEVMQSHNSCLYVLKWCLTTAPLYFHVHPLIDLNINYNKINHYSLLKGFSIKFRYKKRDPTAKVIYILFMRSLSSYKSVFSFISSCFCSSLSEFFLFFECPVLFEAGFVTVINRSLDTCELFYRLKY